MSEVRETTSVRRLRNGKEVTMKMECNLGDPYQYYRGENSDGSGANAVPNWNEEANRPIIWAEIYSNLQRIIYTDDLWTYNVTKLTFGPDGLSTNAGLEGVFKKETYQSVPALKIMKNLASKDNQDNDIITLDCAVKVGGIDDRTQGYITIQIGRASADVYKGTILPVGDSGYTIRVPNGSVKMKGALRFGGSAVPNSEYQVEWKKLVNGELAPLLNDSGEPVSDGSDHSITITAGMVNSAMNLYAIFKDATGNELTSDIQGIVDASDPMYIEKNATPANEVIINESDTVVYKPRVMGAVQENGEMKVVEMTEFSGKFKFYLSKDDGTKITPDNNPNHTASAQQTITANDVDKAEPGDLQIEIIADTSY